MISRGHRTGGATANPVLAKIAWLSSRGRDLNYRLTTAGHAKLPNGKQLVRYSLTDPVIESSEIAGANNVKTQSLTLHFKTVEVQGG